MLSTLDFRQLEAAAERVIALGHSMANRLLTLERDVQKLEGEATRMRGEIAVLAYFLKVNFSVDVGSGGLAHDADVIRLAVELLGELKERRPIMPPHGLKWPRQHTGTPSGPRPPITPPKPQESEQ